MMEEGTKTTTPAAKEQGIDPSFWGELDGEQVFVQLRENYEYISVTYPCNAVMEIGAQHPDGTMEGGGYTTDVGATQAAQQLERANASLPPEQQLRFVARPLRVGVLQGKLRVLRDSSGGWLMIERRDPLDETPADERPKATAKIRFPVDAVAFITTVERNLIL